MDTRDQEVQSAESQKIQEARELLDAMKENLDGGHLALFADEWKTIIAADMVKDALIAHLLTRLVHADRFIARNCGGLVNPARKSTITHAKSLGYNHEPL